MTDLQEYLHSFGSLVDLKLDLEEHSLFYRENENLLLIRYRDKKEVDPFFRKFRGLIIDKETRNIVLCPLSGSTDLDRFQEQVPFDECVIEESIDGTLINVFYYKNDWHVSTKGTLHAECKWSSTRTFKELFLETAKEMNLDISTLNKCFAYGFILGHPECQNIRWYNQPTLYHIYTRNMVTLKETNMDLGITKPRILKLKDNNSLHCISYDDVFDLAAKQELPIRTEGFMLFSKNRQYRVKIPFKTFSDALDLKGNVPHPFYTLMRLIDMQQPFTHLLEYLPNYDVHVGAFHHAMSILVPHLFNVYFKTKILHHSYLIPKIYQKAIIEIHHRYLENLRQHYESQDPLSRQKPFTTIHDVHFYLTQQCDRRYVVEMLKHIAENNFTVSSP